MNGVAMNFFNGGDVMSQYRIEMFGNYNNLEMDTIIDIRTGEHWFTQKTIATALDIDPSTLSHMRSNHPSEFTDEVDVTTASVGGRRQTIYSEDGFFTICDMSTSEEARRLRTWMRKQFKVKREKNALVIEQEKKIEQLPADDLSDLPVALRMAHSMLQQVTTNYRQIEWLKAQREIMSVQIENLERNEKEVERRTSTLEQQMEEVQDALDLKAGEMTASQMAVQVKWVSSGGGPHNGAIILAAANAGYIDNGMMVQRQAEGHSTHGPVLEYVLTPAGVVDFVQNIDSQYSVGGNHTLTPNSVAHQHGMTRRRHFVKKA